MAPLTWLVIAVKDAKGEECSISMCCKRSLGQSCQVIHVVQGRALVVIIASQEKVHVVRGLPREMMVLLEHSQQISESSFPVHQGTAAELISQFLIIKCYINPVCSTFSR